MSENNIGGISLDEITAAAMEGLDEKQQPASKPTKKCNECGKDVLETVNFCPYCGAAMNVKKTNPEKEEKTVCAFCNKEISKTAKFCPYCGKKPNVASTAQRDSATQTNVEHTANRVIEKPAVQSDPTNCPVRQLRTNRGLAKFILLSLVTFGIYSMVCFGNMSSDINLTASRYDGKKTMNFYLLIFLIAPITLGIGSLVWMHKFSARVGAEAERRGTGVSFGAGSFWIWYVLGILIIVGPFVYTYKLFKAMNAINADFNVKG